MISSAFRIVIIGIGGVGGYLGAFLAKISIQESVEVILVSRGKNLDTIRSQGLRIITDDGQATVHSFIITDDLSKLGRIDLLLCCVKGYDLEESIKPLANYISTDTTIIPFLNGINARERLKSILPHTTIWDGCIYLVSRLIETGVVKQTGTLNQILFGSSNGSDENKTIIESIFQRASLKASYSDNITEELWKKFFFISAMATVTSFFNTSMGEIQNNSDKSHFIKDLLSELQQVTLALKISVPNDLVENTYSKIITLAPETTSSMLKDFQKGGKTELEEITGYVVHKSRELGIATPVYNMMYSTLLIRAESFLTRPTT